MPLLMDNCPDRSVTVEFELMGTLREQVRRSLIQSPYQAVRRVQVEERQGVLTLSGRLPNFFLMQMAQSAVAKVEGVRSIVNRIDVAEPVA